VPVTATSQHRRWPEKLILARHQEQRACVLARDLTRGGLAGAGWTLKGESTTGTSSRWNGDNNSPENIQIPGTPHFSNSAETFYIRFRFETSGITSHRHAGTVFAENRFLRPFGCLPLAAG